MGEDSDHESQESHDSAQIEEIVDVVSDQVIIQVFLLSTLKIFEKVEKIAIRKKNRTSKNRKVEIFQKFKNHSK